MVGNAALVLGFAALQLALATGRRLYERIKHGGAALPWPVALEFARFPSQLTFPALLLGPPTATSALVVLGRTRGGRRASRRRCCC